MRDINDVQKDILSINEKILKVKEEKAPVDKELETRAAAFAKETQPLHTEVEQLEEEREKVRKAPAPTPSPYYIVGIVVSIAALLAFPLPALAYSAKRCFCCDFYCFYHY